MSVTPLEVVFIKTNRGLDPAVLAAHTRWLGLPLPGEFDQEEAEQGTNVLGTARPGAPPPTPPPDDDAPPLPNTTSTINSGCPRAATPGSKVTLHVSVISTPRRRELRDATRATWCASAARVVAESGGRLAMTVEFVVGGGDYHGVDALEVRSGRMTRFQRVYSHPPPAPPALRPRPAPSGY